MVRPRFGSGAVHPPTCACFFALDHGAQLGWAVSPMVALGYVLFGATCLVLSRGQADPQSSA